MDPALQHRIWLSRNLEGKYPACDLTWIESDRALNAVVWNPALLGQTVSELLAEAKTGRHSTT
jgi:hypothetical protein